MHRALLRSPPGFGLLIALVISSGLAFAWPRFGLAMDPFRLPSVGLLGLVAMTMFCLGVVVKQAELLELRQRPFTVLLGVALQCTLMPALAWVVVKLLSLEGELAYGVILAGCVPGAMASNVLTMTARGNVSYSVSLTTVATLLSPITVPLALAVVAGLSTDVGSLNPVRTALTLVVTVVIPVVLGHMFQRFVFRIDERAKRVAGWLASVALLWIIASVVAGNRDRLMRIEFPMLVSLLLMNLLGYVGGFGMGRLARMPDAMTRALTLEVGMQNAGLGTALAATLLGVQSEAQIPTAIYTFGCMLTGTLLAGVWGRAKLPGSDSTGPTSFGGGSQDG